MLLPTSPFLLFVSLLQNEHPHSGSFCLVPSANAKLNTNSRNLFSWAELPCGLICSRVVCAVSPLLGSAQGPGTAPPTLACPWTHHSRPAPGLRFLLLSWLPLPLPAQLCPCSQITNISRPPVCWTLAESRNLGMSHRHLCLPRDSLACRETEINKMCYIQK